MNFINWFKNNPFTRYYRRIIKEQEEQEIIATRDYVALATFELGEHCEQLSILLEDERFRLTTFITEEEKKRVDEAKVKILRFSSKAIAVHQNITTNSSFYVHRVGQRSIDEFFQDIIILTS